MSFNICFKLLKKKKKHTSATVELVRSVATVVSSITFLLLQNTIIVLTDKLASLTPCTEPGKNSMRTAPSMLMSICLSVLTACVCVCVCGCVCVFVCVRIWVNMFVCMRLCVCMLTTAEFISFISTVIDPVTLPELGLAQAVLAGQMLSSIAHYRRGGGQRLSGQHTFK